MSTQIDLHLPFLTEADPVASGEGSLDPLGLSPTSERLADEILPGFRARMSRPRFLTAMAVSAAVSNGIEELVGVDGVTPVSVVFEWLLVEAFVRKADRARTRFTPGIQKAQAATQSGEPISAKTYLKTPTVFGFHGVYKPLARRLRIIDDEMRLGDNGYALLKVWAEEQGLHGFVETYEVASMGSAFRKSLRAALEESLATGFCARQAGWSGWANIAAHLTPGAIGREESRYLRDLIAKEDEAHTSEIFELMRGFTGEASEQEIVEDSLMRHASRELGRDLLAIKSFEQAASLLEDAFAWMRYLSGRKRATPLSATDYASEPAVHDIAIRLPQTLRRAEDALSHTTTITQQRFAEVAKYYENLNDGKSLFDAVLFHHSHVQKNKPPEGKRDWVERDGSGAIIVRPQYREPEEPVSRSWWGRPYRISTVQSFLSDMGASA